MIEEEEAETEEIEAVEVGGMVQLTLDSIL